MTATIVDGRHPFAAWLRQFEAANERPPPEPGFRGADVLYYTTARGSSYRVRDDAGRPCLIPCPTPVGPDVEVTDPSLDIVAEAADLLDAEIGSGWFTYRETLFFREDARTLLVYPTERGFQAIAVAEVPAGAERVDVVPADALRFVSANRTPIAGGTDHG